MMSTGGRAAKKLDVASVFRMFFCAGLSLTNKFKTKETAIIAAPNKWPGQNDARKENWIWRGLFTWLVIMPNRAEPKEVLGDPNCTRLNVLKNSAPKLRLTRSLTGVSFDSEISQLSMPNARRVGSTRGSFPRANGPGAAKHAGLRTEVPV